ncbi:MAG: hypothetical protein V1670_02085, partial [Candidatus Omnitrophota bacterium]
MVWDKYLQTVNERGFIERANDFVTGLTKSEYWLETLPMLGSQALNKAIQNALNSIAYDSATWIASGNKGQKPMFITEGWGTYLSNIGDNAAGTFIETLGKSGYTKFNLCQPDPRVQLRINLGLVQYSRPQKPACTFSQMTKNWQKELQSGDFLTKFQDMFNPTSSDLGIALTLQTGIVQDTQVKAQNAANERFINQGWLNLRDLGGKQESAPQQAQRMIEQADRIRELKLGQYTGNALTDAANVFLNQFAITLFNNLMKKIGQGLPTFTQPYSGDYGLTDYNAAPGSGGLAGAKAMLRRLVEPNFASRGDYKILSELTTCTDPNKAGPTNCVIDERLRQAIENKLTVGEALTQGYFNPNGVFGFTSDGLEPRFNEGYPYRSLIILRKYRIIPVGWEVAAQYIKDHPGDIDGTKNIADLINCYSSSDDYAGYYADWCHGLVDPSWVLKAPLNFCKREGPGPEIMSEQVTGTGADSVLSISRNDNYCADEQSCIQENSDGSCSLYGY